MGIVGGPICGAAGGFPEMVGDEIADGEATQGQVTAIDALREGHHVRDQTYRKGGGQGVSRPTRELGSDGPQARGVIVQAIQWSPPFQQDGGLVGAYGALHP